MEYEPLLVKPTWEIVSAALDWKERSFRPRW